MFLVLSSFYFFVEISFWPIYYEHIFIYFIQYSYRRCCTLLGLVTLNCIMEILLIHFIDCVFYHVPVSSVDFFPLNRQCTWLSSNFKLCLPCGREALHMCCTCDSRINQKLVQRFIYKIWAFPSVVITFTFQLLWFPKTLSSNLLSQ